MEDRLVQNISQILLLLLNNRASVNTIVEQTSIYKNYVFEANKFLEQAKLAVPIKDKKVYQQKKFIQLTEFGQELADFIKNTEKFDKSFYEMKIAIKRVYYISQDMQENARRSLLLSRGLNKQEINDYEEDFGYATDFETGSLSVLIEGIVNRYALFLLKFDPNKYAKELLEEVVIRRLSNYLLTKVESVVKNEYYICKNCGGELKSALVRHRIDEMVDESGSRLFNFLGDYVYILFNNRHISNEVKDVINCLFSVIHLPEEYVKQKINEEIEILNSSKIGGYTHEEMATIDNQKKLFNYLSKLDVSA